MLTGLRVCYAFDRDRIRWRARCGLEESGGARPQDRRVAERSCGEIGEEVTHLCPQHREVCLPAQRAHGEHIAFPPAVCPGEFVNFVQHAQRKAADLLPEEAADVEGKIEM